jgi:putative peptide zinc metalloprotease protein
MEPHERVPALTPGVEIGPDRDGEQNVTVSAPVERYFEVSRATARLLRAIDGQRTLEQIAALVGDDGSAPTAADLAGVIDQSLAPSGIVRFGEAPALDEARAPEGPRSRLWLRVPLFPAPLANTLAEPLRSLFAPGIALALMIVGVTAHMLFYAMRPGFGPSLRPESLSSWIAPAALFALAMLIHELGHVAALLARGERAGAVGFGFYWIWPVLFSDVSRAWRLPRRERAIVDAGGVFVQLLVAAVMIGIWIFAPSVTLARGIALVDLGLVANLNPLLRWDGYWLLVDLTGVTDLRRRGFDYLRALRRGQRAAAPRAVQVYAALSALYAIAVGAWIALVLVPWILRLFESRVA